jgi:hypothetical protein
MKKIQKQIILKILKKGEAHLRTGHEGPEGGIDVLFL